MDYSEYFRLALAQRYSGNFPVLRPEIFDRRCRLKRVPDAVRAAYLTIGASRITPVQRLLVEPGELESSAGMVFFIRTGTIGWAFQDGDGDDPPVHRLERIEHHEDGTETLCFSHDGETRFARFIAALIADPRIADAGAATDVSGRGGWERVLDFLQMDRKTLRIWTWLAAFWFFPVMFWGGDAIRRFGGDTIGAVAAGGTLLTGAVLIFSLIRLYFHYNIWLDRDDNVRYADASSPEAGKLRDLIFTFFRRSQPELWVDGIGWASLNASIFLRCGALRSLQGRYDFCAPEPGILEIPGGAPIVYEAHEEVSLLFRASIAPDGCLRFDRCDRGRFRKHPPRLRTPGEFQMKGNLPSS